ncbi:hypothetical protein [Larsenimonas rhizosphaerae]|uniref:Uncharacterized protein n=1 Tax=Larsenimonas rhizosphaerae TaxID=2944682 RepID=A0AA42CYT8_9GAMM|nr:hypothetical protein [Larsenimonas rhizosphaerae]MCX2525593.1 hypothetical protein [Larsenimonas rhizosphaerae]
MSNDDWDDLDYTIEPAGEDRQRCRFFKDGEEVASRVYHDYDDALSLASVWLANGRLEDLDQGHVDV